jgi:hypothetical protein
MDSMQDSLTVVVIAANKTTPNTLVINKINFNHQSVQTVAEQQSSYISYLKECSRTQTKQTSTQLSLD